MKSNSIILCPCSSGNSYEECCKHFHKGSLPKTALELMRSRYSAYALNLSEYIMETTHPSNPVYSHNKSDWKHSIELFSKHTVFQKLDILDYQKNVLGKDVFATVTFKAHLLQHHQNVTFTEKSLFEKINRHWLYLSGKID